MDLIELCGYENSPFILPFAHLEHAYTEHYEKKQNDLGSFRLEKKIVPRKKLACCKQHLSFPRPDLVIIPYKATDL